MDALSCVVVKIFLFFLKIDYMICNFCSQKCGYLLFDCRCGKAFCLKCLKPEIHGCSINRLKENQEKLKKELFSFEKRKLDNI